MSARVRWLPLAPVVLLAAAAALGVLAAAQPVLALAAAAGLVVAGVVFADLAAGVAVLMFLTFLAVLPSSGSLTPVKAVGLLIALGWLARFTVGERGERDFFADHSHLTWVMIAFLGWAALTLVWAPQLGTGLSVLSQYGLDFLLLPIAYTAVRGVRDLKLVAAAIVFGAIVAACAGILQPPNAGVIENSRATGTIGDPNELAAALLVGLMLGTGLLLARGSSVALRLGGLIAIPLCALGIFLSVSRGGLVALTVTLIAGTFLAGRWRAAVAGLLIALAVGGVLYFTQLAPLPARERVLTAGGGSGRTELWKVGLRVVKANPVGGVGVGNFVAVSPKYALQPGLITAGGLIFTPSPFPPHNAYLQILAEMGVPGLTLFLAVIVVCLGCALRAARLAVGLEDLTLESLARAVMLALVGVLTAEFFISQMHSKLLWGLLALCPAMLAIARHEQAARDTGDPG